MVVPHVGTWIEILGGGERRECVLVVPHVGTWIEMVSTVEHKNTRHVVPHVGTWIEIPRPPLCNMQRRRASRRHVD